MRARAAIPAALAILLLLARAAAAATAPASLQGWFLVAAPDMPDPRFAGTVIYMIRHGPDGAMGFVINRVLAEDWAENILDPDSAPAERTGRKIRVHYGGPVGPAEGFILHSGDYETGNSVRVAGNVWLSADPELLREMARREGPARGLFVLGYSGGLGAGAARVRARARRLGRRARPGDTDLLFDPDLAGKWRRSSRRLANNGGHRQHVGRAGVAASPRHGRLGGRPSNVLFLSASICQRKTPAWMVGNPPTMTATGSGGSGRAGRRRPMFHVKHKSALLTYVSRETLA